MCQNVVGKKGEVMNGFKKIGEKIRYYREKRGLSQKMLAKRTFMTAEDLRKLKGRDNLSILDASKNCKSS